MAQVSEIQLDELIERGRFDAEFFTPNFVNLEKDLKEMSITNFSYFCKFIKKGIFDISPDKYVTSKGVPFIRTSDIKSDFLGFSSPAQIDMESHELEKKTELSLNDLLLTKVGMGIGDASINFYYKKLNLSQNVVGVKIKREFQDESGFLMVFLNSKYGQFQIERKLSGQAQPKINLEDFRTLLVPNLDDSFRKKIHNLSKEAFEEALRSKNLYQQAEQLLLKELGLEDFTPEWVAGYETDYENVLAVARMDAEYFQPRYEIVKNKIRAVDHDTLGNLVKPLKKGIEVGSEAYADEGIPFLRVSNIEKLRIDNSSEQYITKELYEELKDKFCPRKGEILLSKDGTPGIAYFLTEEVKTIISGGIVRLKSFEVEPEYLTLVLNSLIVQDQIEQDAGGALIKHWRPDQIKTTLIPILPKLVREKIVAMVQESFSALYESRQLLEQAKREVEEMIEYKTIDEEKSKLATFN